MYQARLLILKWLLCVGLLILQQEAVATECAEARGCNAGRIWVEAFNLGGGGGGGTSFLTAGLDLNMPFKEHTIALGYRNMSQNYLSSRYDGDTGLPINGRLKAMSVSRVWHWPSRFGYLSSSLGLSLLKGSVGEDCEKAPSFMFAHYNCYKNDVSTVGIPLRVSAGFGRYVGVAAHIELNINPDVPYILTTFSFPIGMFAK